MGSLALEVRHDAQLAVRSGTRFQARCLTSPGVRAVGTHHQCGPEHVPVRKTHTGPRLIPAQGAGLSLNEAHAARLLRSRAQSSSQPTALGYLRQRRQTGIVGRKLQAPTTIPSHVHPRNGLDALPIKQRPRANS